MNQHNLISVFLIIPIAGVVITFSLMILEKIIHTMFELIKIYMRHTTIRKVGWPTNPNMDADGDIMETNQEEKGEEDSVDIDRRSDDKHGPRDHQRKSER